MQVTHASNAASCRHLAETVRITAALHARLGWVHWQVRVAEDAGHGAAEQVRELARLQHQHLVVRAHARQVVARLRQLALRVTQPPF